MLGAVLGLGGVSVALGAALVLAIRAWRGAKAEGRLQLALNKDLARQCVDLQADLQRQEADAEAELQRIQEAHAEDILRHTRAKEALQAELRQLEEDLRACSTPDAVRARLNRLLAPPPLPHP